MMCQPASHHTGLLARPRSPAKSVLIMDRMTNSILSHIHSALLHTGRDMHDPAVQSQRSWVRWEVSWWRPHERGHSEDTSLLCLWQNKVSMYEESKFNQIKAIFLKGQMITSLCNFYIVHLWPSKNRRKCTSQVRWSKLGKRWLPLPINDVISRRGQEQYFRIFF